MSGGAGVDTYNFISDGNGTLASIGIDLVDNLSVSEGDILDISDLLSGLIIKDIDDFVQINYDTSNNDYDLLVRQSTSDSFSHIANVKSSDHLSVYNNDVDSMVTAGLLVW